MIWFLSSESIFLRFYRQYSMITKYFTFSRSIDGSSSLPLKYIIVQLDVLYKHIKNVFLQL